LGDTTQASTIEGDRKRTLKRNEDALNALNGALKLGRPGWATFDQMNTSPQSATEDELDELHLLNESIESKLSLSSESAADSPLWNKGKKLLERLFISMSPFAKNFLFVAKELQSVRIE
jgi:hypothetical protein